jgi:predicted metal-binding protein
MPFRERYLWVCTNRRADDNPRGSCAAKGSEALIEELKRASRTAGQGARVRIMSSSCIDHCEHGITAAVMPDGVLLGQLTADDVPALVRGLETAGGVLAESSLAPRQLTAENTSPEALARLRRG